MNKQLQLFKLLKLQSEQLFEGSHSVHTAEFVVDKILNNIDTSYDSFLVLYNIEFALSLIHKYGVDPKNITFLSDHENKSNLANRLNINYSSVTEAVFMNKRPIMLINPPYTNGSQDASEIYTAIINNCIDKFNPIAIGGVTPENLINGGQKKKTLRNKLNEKYNLKYLRFLSQKRDWNGKIKVDTVSWVYDENYIGKTQVVSRYSNVPYTTDCLDEYIDGANQTIHDWIIKSQTSKKIKLLGANPRFTEDNQNSKEQQVKISKNFTDSYTLESGKWTDSHNTEWRIVFGYMRCNTLAIVPPGPSIPGKYRYLPFGQDEVLARKFADYMLSEPVRFIMKLVYTSRTLDNPQLSYVPFFDLSQFNTVSNSVLYSFWNIDKQTQSFINNVVGDEVPF
jgi:hypothetical protein|tara:strand:+ start:72 stop:1256 length:1185 start_codon:yes stop_codon:yes gene_type:complete